MPKVRCLFFNFFILFLNNILVVGDKLTKNPAEAPAESGPEPVKHDETERENVETLGDTSHQEHGKDDARDAASGDYVEQLPEEVAEALLTSYKQTQEKQDGNDGEEYYGDDSTDAERTNAEGSFEDGYVDAEGEDDDDYRDAEGIQEEDEDYLEQETIYDEEQGDASRTFWSSASEFIFTYPISRTRPTF